MGIGKAITMGAALAGATAGVVVLSGALSGCATSHKPCSEGGDVSWQTPIKGDRTCYQKTLPDGRIINHGKFYQYDLNGKLVLEGEFIEGLKHGNWIQYDATGRKISEKYFEDGVERTIPAVR